MDRRKILPLSLFAHGLLSIPNVLPHVFKGAWNTRLEYIVIFLSPCLPDGKQKNSSTAR